MKSDRTNKIFGMIFLTLFLVHLVHAAPLTLRSATLALTAFSPNGDGVQDGTRVTIRVSVTGVAAPVVLRATWTVNRFFVNPYLALDDGPAFTSTQYVTLTADDLLELPWQTVILPWDGRLEDGSICPDGTYASQGTVELLKPTGTILSTCAFTLPNIRVDTVAPVVTLLSPVDGALIGKANPLVILSHGEPKFSVTISYKVDSLLVPSLNLSEGDHTLQAGMKDAAGNTGWSQIHHLEVDLTPPQLTVLAPQNSQHTWPTIALTGTVSDLHFKKVTVNGQEATLLQLTIWSHTITVPTGLQTLTIRAEDQAGLVTTQTRFLQVDPFPTGTALVGTILFRDGTPVAGVAVTLLNMGAGVLTDTWGRFAFTTVWSPTPLSLRVNPPSMSGLGSSLTTETRQVAIPWGQATMVIPLWLRARQSALNVVGTQDQWLTTPDCPGFALFLKAHTVRFPDGNDFGTLTVKERDPLLEGLTLPSYLKPSRLYDIGPRGIGFTTPPLVRLPNRDGWGSGSQVAVWRFFVDRVLVEPDGDLVRGDEEVRRAMPISGPLPAPRWLGRGRLLSDHTAVELGGGEGWVGAAVLGIAPMPLRMVFGAEFSPTFNDAPTAHRVPVGAVEIMTPTGQLHYRYPIPGLNSLGAQRGPVLSYSTGRVNPSPVVAVDITIPAEAPLPQRLTVECAYQTGPGTTRRTRTVVLTTTGLNEDAEEVIRQSLELGTLDLATGLIPFRITLTAEYGDGSLVKSELAESALNVNLRVNPLGVMGWGVEGVQSLSLQADGDLLLQEGSPTALRFRHQPDGSWLVTDSQAGYLGVFASTLVVFDTTVNTVIGGFARAAFDQRTEGMGAGSDGRLWVGTGFIDRLAVVDPSNADETTDRTVATNIEHTDKIVVHPDNTYAYLLDRSQRRVVVIRESDLATVATVPVPPALGTPYHLAISPTGDQLAIAALDTSASPMDLAIIQLTHGLPAATFGITLASGEGSTNVAYTAGTPPRLLVGTQDSQLVALNPLTFAEVGRFVLHDDTLSTFSTQVVVVTNPVKPRAYAFVDHGYIGNILGLNNTLVVVDTDSMTVVDRQWWLGSAPVNSPYGAMTKDGRSVYFSTVRATIGVGSNHLIKGLQAYNPGGMEVNLQSIEFAVPSMDDFVLGAEKTSSASADDPSRLTLDVKGNADPSDDEYVRFDTNGTVSRFTNAGKLLATIDKDGNTTSFSYLPTGKLNTITYPGNRVFTFGYDGSGRIATITDDTTRQTAIQADGENRVITLTDPNQQTTTLGYINPQDHFIIQVTEPNGAHTNAVFNEICRCSLAIAPDGGQYRFRPAEWRSWQMPWSEGTLTNPALPIRVSVIRSTLIEPGNVSRTYQLDRYGQVVSELDPLGLSTTQTRDGQGNLLAISLPNGAVTTMNYDLSANLTQVTDPVGATTAFTYSPQFSQVTSVTDPLGRFTTLTLDAKGNPVEIRDALLTPTRMGYNAQGLLVGLTDALGNITQFRYDSQGRLTLTVDPLLRETRQAYDVQGRVTLTTDPLGRSTRFAYDPVGRLTLVTDALNGQTKYLYDGSGNLLAVTDANSHVWSFVYDAMSRVTLSTNPLGQQKRFTYDVRGDLVQSMNENNEIITYAYDALHRLTLKVLPDAGVLVSPITRLTYGYDTVGQLTTAVVLTGEPPVERHRLEHFYDLAGRLTLQVTSDPAWGPTPIPLAFAYDAAGRRTSLIVDTLAPVTYAYDALGRCVTLASAPYGTWTYTYDPLGRRSSVTYPFSVTTTLQYDGASQLTLFQHLQSTTLLLAQTWTYDFVGNRTTLQQDGLNLTAAGAHTYQYDFLSRLQTAQHTNPLWPHAPFESYTYDAVGNRLISHTHATYGPDAANRYTNVAGAIMAYDSAGQLTLTDAHLGGGFGVIGYRYRADGLLVGVLIEGLEGKAGWREYDALGRLMNEDGAPILQDGAQIVRRGPNLHHLWGPALDEELLQRDPAGTVTSYRLLDSAGHTVLTTTGVQSTLRVRAPFGTFGEVAPGSSPIGWHGTIAAQLAWDLRARLYLPSLGRFMSEDPSGMTDGTNLFTYGGNNPVNFTDPWGLFRLRGDVPGGATVALQKLKGLILMNPDGRNYLMQNEPHLLQWFDKGEGPELSFPEKLKARGATGAIVDAGGGYDPNDGSLQIMRSLLGQGNFLYFLAMMIHELAHATDTSGNLKYGFGLEGRALEAEKRFFGKYITPGMRLR